MYKSINNKNMFKSTISTLILGLLLVCQGFSQDTMYVYKNGVEVFSKPVSDIDSITFYKSKGNDPLNTVKDISGNIYPTVTLGSQVWMAQNLKTEKYNDGSAIPLIFDESSWAENDNNGDTAPMMTWYNFDKATYFPKFYGGLYNYYAINYSTNGGKNVCPIGWHIPNQTDFNILKNWLIVNGYNYDGTTNGNSSSNNKLAKAIASRFWGTTGGSGTGTPAFEPEDNNYSGFNGLPVGQISYSGSHGLINTFTGWWSITEYDESNSYLHSIASSRKDFTFGTVGQNKNFGHSVRCLKN